MSILATSCSVAAEVGVAGMRHSPRRLLRVAVVGCGAIAEQIHLPVLAGHEGVELAALVDRDERRARKLADGYGVKTVVRDADDLPEGSIDAAIVATPPFHHAPGSIALMRRGIHVLVEKPVALNLPEAEEMCRVAEERRVTFAVGLYRRLLPVTRLFGALLRTEQWGRPLSFSYEWGGLGGYGSTTLGLLRKDLAGGGVLIDLGAHVLDQLVAIFGDGGRVLTYRDDARGGIEADCRLELEFVHRGEAVRGVVELSRVRNLANRLEIRCERATLSAALNERYSVTVRSNDGESLVVRAEGADEEPWFETYRAEIDDWITAIGAGTQPLLAGRTVLPSVRLIDTCYQIRQPLAVAWLDRMPPRIVPAGTNGKRRKVLLTGGGGFIGCRTAEILSLNEGYDVRAIVRGAATASKLARLPLEMIQGDLKSDDDIRRAVEGCDALVHCAVGTAYGNPREIEAVTVGGTKRLAAAARALGIQRFVHLSSIGVHDGADSQIIDGSTPVRPARGDDYGRTKALAESVIRSEERRGLSVAVLRPGCVYGPFGHTFVVNPLRALADNRLVLEDSADTPANTVYVDHLVQAIVCALVADHAAVQGRAFAIGDGDDCTWGEYYDWFAERMGAAVIRRTQSSNGSTVSGRRFFGGIADVVRSVEAKSFAKRVLHSDPLGAVPRWLLARYPRLETGLRNLVGMNAPTVYRRSEGQADAAAVVVRPRHGRISIAEAQTHLKYSPSLPRQEAQQITWEWVRYARIV